MGNLVITVEGFLVLYTIKNVVYLACIRFSILYFRHRCDNVRDFFVYFFGGLECIRHSFAYVAHFVFLRDV